MTTLALLLLVLPFACARTPPSVGFAGQDIVACVELASSSSSSSTPCQAIGNASLSTTYTSVAKDGTPKYETMLYFTSVDNMLAFENAPFSYLPKYGGFDGNQIGDNNSTSSWSAAHLGPSVDVISSWRVSTNSGGTTPDVYLFKDDTSAELFLHGLPKTRSAADAQWSSWFGEHGTSPPYAVHGGPFNTACFVKVPSGATAAAGRDCSLHPQ
jgi:hypothetical protein